jgi:Flp pilus assembly protein TadD
LAHASAEQLVEIQRRVEEWIAAGQYQTATDYVLELHGEANNSGEMSGLLSRILQARKEAETQLAVQEKLTQSETATSLTAPREPAADVETLHWAPAPAQELTRTHPEVARQAAPVAAPRGPALEPVALHEPLLAPARAPVKRPDRRSRAIRRSALVVFTGAALVVLLTAGWLFRSWISSARRGPERASAPVSEAVTKGDAVSADAPVPGLPPPVKAAASASISTAARADAIAAGFKSPATAVQPAIAPPAIESFLPDRHSIRPGQSVVLRWMVSRDVSELRLNPGGPIPNAATSQEVFPTGTTTYTLIATNANATAEASSQVEVIPFVPPSITRLRAEPESINPGQTARLIWEIGGDVDKLELSPGVGIALDQRSVEVSPRATTAYHLEASGPAGRSSESVLIEVARRVETSAPIPAITANLTRPNDDAEAQRFYRDAEQEVIAKNYERAAVLFGRASKLNHSWKDPLVQKAIVDAKLGLFASVVEDCDEALRLDGADAEAHNFRGFALYSLNHNQEAVSEFNEAIRLKPDYAEAYVNRGNAMVALHDNRSANADFALARSLQNQKKKR